MVAKPDTLELHSHAQALGDNAQGHDLVWVRCALNQLDELTLLPRIKIEKLQPVSYADVELSDHSCNREPSTAN